MRKPDPSRFTGRQKRKPEELTMKGFSAASSEAAQAGHDVKQGPPSSPPPENTTKIEAPAGQQKVRTNVPTYERPNERTSVRKKERVKIRHAFDIFEDQLRELQLLQLEAVRSSKKKPNLGDMVQEAIDLFLKREQRRREKK